MAYNTSLTEFIAQKKDVEFRFETNTFNCKNNSLLIVALALAALGITAGVLILHPPQAMTFLHSVSHKWAWVSFGVGGGVFVMGFVGFIYLVHQHRKAVSIQKLLCEKKLDTLRNYITNNNFHMLEVPKHATGKEARERYASIKIPFASSHLHLYLYKEKNKKIVSIVRENFRLQFENKFCYYNFVDITQAPR